MLSRSARPDALTVTLMLFGLGTLLTATLQILLG